MLNVRSEEYAGEVTGIEAYREIVATWLVKDSEQLLADTIDAGVVQGWKILDELGTAGRNYALEVRTVRFGWLADKRRGITSINLSVGAVGDAWGRLPLKDICEDEWKGPFGYDRGLVYWWVLQRSLRGLIDFNRSNLETEC